MLHKELQKITFGSRLKGEKDTEIPLMEHFPQEGNENECWKGKQTNKQRKAVWMILFYFFHFI